MAFTIIDNRAPEKQKQDGSSIAVSARAVKVRGGGTARYISIGIGYELAAKLGMSMTRETVNIALGRDNDAGKVAIIRAPGGQFVAKGKVGKNYRFTINPASAAGLFALEFEGFTRSNLEVVRQAGTALCQVAFLATGQMLDAGE